MDIKEYYYVPVYMMLVEDSVCRGIEFKFLDNIIVSKTKNGYEELDSFNNFVILKSERDDNKRLSIVNYDECLYLNSDDFTEENKVEFYTFHDEKEKIRCYRKLNQKFKMEFYQKDNFDYFVKTKKESVKKKKNYK